MAQTGTRKCTKIWITRCEKSRFYIVLAKIWVKNLDELKKEKHKKSFYKFDPVLAKIWIN